MGTSEFRAWSLEAASSKQVSETGQARLTGRARSAVAERLRRARSRERE